MFKTLFKRNKNKKQPVLGLTEIVNYDIAIDTNVNTEKMYKLFSEDKIHLLESLDNTINNLNSKRIIKEKQLQNITKQIQDSKEFLLQNRNKLECSICNDKEIDTVLNPCGHTFCKTCLGNTNYCYICRSFIINPIKLYLN